ncbi:hypothetical protein CLAFUW4_04492 [Fulvia fulva]|uniref:Uncharacterized protein n=1 Tax=Passalora fulva TaxID=5499 RepID=A0A9Q8LFX6_PASFU|nr:uncharacterized protein CLAFUR5_04457 [Fulvia fulva]KAK4626783.1 hypothetical protein CLAFUR4_04478 [Fulvia fulva]KAK4628004.1 hypothetical protein CLAFUR0_04481 [Fulvia fulva]UJO16660.1 hypothetical protein CLAFUR5_04457 [Fulvia fulva]WPV14134.1 hypothetical protein CLAFUW4_04492 [Fulvia fulva]WPV28991.1 hypothetical protein CLAFUW7_04484 [Fulvia fulva]
MQGFITAINKRDFDVNSAAWSHASPEFTGEVERPPGDSDLTPPGMMPLQDHLAMFLFMAQMYPDYFIKIFDLTTEVDEKAGTATMFWNGETHGVPTGVVMPSVGICDFKRYGQKWMCISFKGARGMGDGIPEEPMM